MPLILAIEPDRRQAHELTAMVRGHLRATLVLADAAEAALASLGDRVPDLILTSALLSAKDETLLAEWLRTLNGAAARVQTLTIPVLETPMPRGSTSRTGIFALLGDRVSSPAAPDGCDPAVFAEQCAAYLERDANERGPVEPLPAIDDVVLPDEPEAPADEMIAAVEMPPPEVQVPETPPPPQAVMPIEESIEIDLSAMLDEAVFQELSEAIETVSRDSAAVAAPATSRGGDVWTPSSLGAAAVWPSMDFATPAKRGSASASATPSRTSRFPARKPIQDEWGFFDPAQCGFSALLAKLDEITHVDPPAGSPERHRR
jgi:hypothetical protein